MTKLRDYVVIDIETTGVLRNRNRLIEIAMLRCRDGEVVHEMITLVNPNRDLGPTHIHGISAAHVQGAPTFAEIAGDVLHCIRGTEAVVGHNVLFDVGILRAEFSRLQVELNALPLMCTMSLAYQFGPASRRLDQCCSQFGIKLQNAHSAESDAKATLSLFREYLKLMEQQRLLHHAVPAFRAGESEALPSVPISGKRKLRSDNSAVSQLDFIGDLIRKLPESGSFETARYYSVLDRALEDRRITPDEAEHLDLVATETGLSRDAAQEANHDYLRNLVQLALSDQKITDSEATDLRLVAGMLNVHESELNAMIEEARARIPDTVPFVGASLEGSTVCFTGTLMSRLNGALISREQAEELARKAGLVPVTGVTKKTNILVIADPDSMSGKAKKARDYGTRIMAERTFWNAIGVSVE